MLYNEQPVTVSMRSTNPDFRNIVLNALRDAGAHDLAGQIALQTRPPKPPEPNGLGAVVKDAKGDRWTRPNLHPRGEWFHENGFDVAAYDDIDVVEVLRVGVAGPRYFPSDTRPL